MRARSIVSEAFRNITSGTSRAFLFGALLAAITAALAIIDARAVARIEAEATGFVASGASVRVLIAERTTDGQACERLGGVAGIKAAGALKQTDAVVLRAMIANPIPAYTVTPGLIRILGGTAAAPAGAWLPAGLAQTLGVRPGQELATTAGPVTLAGVYDYPDDGRDGRLTYAALFPQTPAGTFDECWANVWPLSESRDQLLYSAITVDKSSSDPVSIGQLNTSRGTTFDGVAQFADRPTRHVVPGCVLAGLLLGFLAVRLRRLEIAGALHVGVSRRAVLATLLIETAVWSFVALVLAACALVFGVLAGNPADPLEMYLIDIRGPAAAAFATLAGAVLASFTIREKHLFAYFKDR